MAAGHSFPLLCSVLSGPSTTFYLSIFVPCHRSFPALGGYEKVAMDILVQSSDGHKHSISLRDGIVGSLYICMLGFSKY